MIDYRVEVKSDVIEENNVIIRSGVTAFHNSAIKEDAFVGPKALVGAYITNEESTYIGQGVILISCKAENIGRNTFVGVGAMVTKPLHENVVAVGSPARIIKP